MRCLLLKHGSNQSLCLKHTGPSRPANPHQLTHHEQTTMTDTKKRTLTQNP